MKKNHSVSLFSALILSLLSLGAIAQTTLYTIRVDGLACPYCAYGIEKKLNEINGIKFLDINLDKGLVTVKANNVKLEDSQLKKLFEDSGFTYRSKKQSSQ